MFETFVIESMEGDVCFVLDRVVDEEKAELAFGMSMGDIRALLGQQRTIFLVATASPLSKVFLTDSTLC